MLIGIAGLKRCGKDTVADYLVKNYNFTKRPMAYPLKKICKTLFKLNDQQLHGNLKEIEDERWYGATPRELMQYVGTDLLRNQLDNIMPGIGKDIFLNNFKVWYDKNKCENIVIPDIRFENEYEMVKSLGGIILSINRKPFSNIKDFHESEQLEIKPDYIIFNKENDLFHLYDSIDKFILFYR